MLRLSRGNQPNTLCDSVEKVASAPPLPRRSAVEREDTISHDRFLEILHRVLDNNEDNPAEEIISWSDDGLSFQVHNSKQFEDILLPKYFGEDSDSKPPLQTYFSFLERLRSYGFHRVSGNDVRKDTCSHPLFVRGKKYLSVKMISRPEPLAKPLFGRQSSWPMPSLSSKSTRRGMKKAFRRSSLRSRPLRASMSRVKKVFTFSPRSAAPHSSGDRVKKGLSFKETLLMRRKPSILRNQYHHEKYDEHRRAALLGRLMGRIRINDGGDDRNSETSFDTEPFSLTSSHISLHDIHSIDEQEILDMQIDHFYSCRDEKHHRVIVDMEPLDPIYHEDDESLHGDIVTALAGI